MFFQKNTIKKIQETYFLTCVAIAGFCLSPTANANNKGRNFKDLIEDTGAIADAGSKASLSVAMLAGIIMGIGGLIGIALANKTNNAQSTRTGSAVIMLIGVCLMAFEGFSNMGTNTIVGTDVEYTEFIE
ncbi:DUF6750 family protein [Aliivibrio fischeri]|uniref:Conjugal transfer protein TrbC n=1 Tax=Aliivibrio fischeri (strain MJ11) TaxID=388396 RepID=B5EW70_ALIFM|nr:DUF6750 family protein [Aliivibrio fischeri]ACH64737.1 hypothetical protein VFMJ11_B0127 [Aliivibrio fischeri MJ11]MUK37604.1 hypothetical protein [Aliivibrio fischeri]